MCCQDRLSSLEKRPLCFPCYIGCMAYCCCGSYHLCWTSSSGDWLLVWAGVFGKEAVYGLDGIIIMLVTMLCCFFFRFAIGGYHMLPLLAVQPRQLQFIPSLIQPQPLLFVILEMLMRCAPDQHVKRQSVQLLLDVLQDATTTSSSSKVNSSSSSGGVDSSSSSWVHSSSSSNSSRGDSSSTGRATPATAPSAAAAALTSYGTTLPLLGALVTASKVTAAEVKWSLGDLGVMLKQLLLLSKLTFEVMGQLLGSIEGTSERKEAGRDGKQQQHAVHSELSAGGHEAAAHGSRRAEGEIDRVVEGLERGSSTPAVQAARSATSEALRAALTAGIAAACAAARGMTSSAAAGTAGAGEMRIAMGKAVAAAVGPTAATVLCNCPALSSVPKAAKARTIAEISTQCADGVSAVLAATLNCPANAEVAAQAAATRWAEASMTGDVLAVVDAVAAMGKEAAAAGDVSAAAMGKEKPDSRKGAGVEQEERVLGTTSKLAPEVLKEGEEVEVDDPHDQHRDKQQQQQGAVQSKQAQGEDREQRQQQGKDWGNIVVLHDEGQQQEQLQRGVEVVPYAQVPKQQQQQEADMAVGQRLCSRTQQLGAVCGEQQVEGLLWAGCLSFSVVLNSLLRLTHAAAVRAQEKADVAPPKSSLGSDWALIAARGCWKGWV